MRSKLTLSDDTFTEIASPLNWHYSSERIDDQ